MEKQRWAAAHFRVERDSTGLLMRKRQRRKATEQAIEHGDPVPEHPRDIVRIFDREGEVVFEQDWGSERSGAMAQEARIVDDLLHLEVIIFCSKYGIVPPELPREATPAAAAEPGDDLVSGAEAPGRSEQGSG